MFSILRSDPGTRSLTIPDGKEQEGMRALTIEARNLDSAQALYAALAGFDPELIGSEVDGFFVIVELGGFNGHVLAVLEVLEAYVTESRELARVELDGRSYALRPDDDGLPSRL